MQTRIFIKGTGSYVPENIVTNHDLEKIMDTNDEWITKMVGIKQRHMVGNTGLVTSDLAAKAAVQALENAKIDASEVDVIITATVTSDMKFPSTSIFVQDKIKAVNAAVFDISAACSGFIYGLQLAESLIYTQKYKNILLIGAEYLSSMINYRDRSTAVLFGDGAGAVVLQPSDGVRGLRGSYIKSDGRLHNLLYSKGGGTKTEPTVDIAASEKIASDDENDKRMFIRMEGNKVYKYAVRAMIDSANKAMEKANITAKDVDMLIPHQANLRIIDAIAQRMNLPPEKVYINLDKVGNTSAASIPIALDQALKEERIKVGDNVVIAAFGGGFTWGGAVIKI